MKKVPTAQTRDTALLTKEGLSHPTSDQRQKIYPYHQEFAKNLAFILANLGGRYVGPCSAGISLTTPGTGWWLAFLGKIEKISYCTNKGYSLADKGRVISSHIGIKDKKYTLFTKNLQRI